MKKSYYISAAVFVIAVLLCAVPGVINIAGHWRDIIADRDTRSAISSAIESDKVREAAVTINGGFAAAVFQPWVKDSEPRYNVLKLDNGYLTFDSALIGEDEEKTVALASGIADYLADSEVPVVYTMIPEKLLAPVDFYPYGLVNYYKVRESTRLAHLESSGLEVIDLCRALADSEQDWYSAFFKTDHHWLPQTGLWAAGVIAEEISGRLGFEYDETQFNADSYTYETLENWFLGSQGKRVGVLFAGADDFTVIHPDFETDMESYTHWSYGWEYRGGTLEDCLYWYSKISEKDYFNTNPYALYSGSDPGIQIIRNLNAQNEIKLLVIRQSFACVVTPFLSLAVRELRAVDLRYANIDITEYIEEYQPDLVLFLMT